MSSNNFSRRKFLQLTGGAGVLSILAPLSALANGPSLPDFLNQPEIPLEIERQQLIKEVRDKVLGFDLRELAHRLASSFDFIPDLKEKIDEALEGADTSQGLKSYRTIDKMKVYKAFNSRKKTQHIPEHIIKDKIKGILEAGSNLLSPQEKKDERVVELYKERIAMLTRSLINSLLDIDNEKLERHVKRYTEKDMAIYYGPSTNIVESIGGLFHETFAHYLQMVHGRQATELWSVDPPNPTATLNNGTKNNPQVHNLFNVLFDPKYQHIAMISHGAWDSYSLSGYYLEPIDVLAKLLELYNREPEKAVDIIFNGNFDDLAKRLGVKQGAFSLENELFNNFTFSNKAGNTNDEIWQKIKKSGNFVRYTCGHEKYKLIDGNLWEVMGFLPPNIRKMISYNLHSSSFSAQDPSFVGQYEDMFRQALNHYNQKQKKEAKVRENNGFGLPFVKGSDQLYGYEGSAWLDSYIENPIPFQGSI